MKYIKHHSSLFIIAVLRQYKIFSIVILLFNSNLRAQLVTDGTLTPAQLVQNVLLGAGVTVSNVTFTGITGIDTSAIGQFSGNTNIGLTKGIVMTTGTIYGSDGPEGPNNNDYSGIDNNRPGDKLLDDIVHLTDTTDTYNAAVLEFDFIPATDNIKFRYVFGSEEYPEYVCSKYNDVFGFFISGDKPGGQKYINQNIALVPNTQLAVAINTINPGYPGADSSAGVCSSSNFAYSAYYVDNTNGTTIQYDGFTKALTAEADVICGSKYHIKLAIADVGDGIYDSGVFLEAGSLMSSSSCEILVPNVFSPNSDGKNEYFVIKNLQNYSCSKLTIYNRWGLVVYESDCYLNNWDGDGVPDGTYYYVLNLSNGEKARYGFLTVLR